MLRTNLSTRPFYNERSVHTVLALVAVVALALSVFNVTRIISLSRRHTELSSHAAQAEGRARDLRSAAAAIRRGINPKELEEVSSAALEANAIIDRRTFSWTELFNRFESTLPPDVRIAAVRPKITQDDAVMISMSIIGRQVDDIDRFIENLEATGAFVDVLSREESATEDGMVQTTLEGRYVPSRAQSQQPANRP